MATDSFDVNPPSLDGNANGLLEAAGLLLAGQPEPGLVAHVQSPKAHADVVAANDTFAAFAADQYQDAIALLAALSTRLTSSSTEYTTTDADTAGYIDEVLTGSTFVPADERGG
jgi:hypothetical protein